MNYGSDKLLFLAGRLEKIAKNNLTKVPLVRQELDYTCGAAALTSVLYYWAAFDGEEEDLYENLGVSEEDGTPGQGIVDVCRKLGLKASMLHQLSLQNLKKLVDNGYTVIINIQAWPEEKATDWTDMWEDGHYVVVVGFNKNQIILMDPSLSGKYGKMPIKEFIDRWHDYSYDLQGYDYRQAIAIKGKNPNPEIKKIKTEKVG